MRLIGRGFLVALLLAGCAGTTVVPNYASELPGYPPPEPGVEMTECGIATEAPEAIACFDSGVRAGQPVELVEATETLDGDPVYVITRFLGPDQVVVYYDSTQDSHAAPPLRFSLECRSVTTGSDGISPIGCNSRQRPWKAIDANQPSVFLGDKAPLRTPEQRNLRS
jgi:hypothetical protein